MTTVSDNIKPLEIKPPEIKSVTIKNQQLYGTCYAHGIARNFVRTLQLLNVIKPKYNEIFYLLFLSVLTENTDCYSGGDYDMLFYLLNWIKINYTLISKYIINLKCYDSTTSCVMFDDNDELLFNTSIKEILDYLYIAKYNYVLDFNDINNNKPTQAINTFLELKLQPCMCFTDRVAGHMVNLRSWNDNIITIKNSYGNTWGTDGNKTYNNICECFAELMRNSFEFTLYVSCISLMFDRAKLPQKYEEQLSYNIRLFNPINISQTQPDNIPADLKSTDGFLTGTGTYTDKYCNLTGHFRNGIIINANGTLLQGCRITNGIFENDVLTKGSHLLISADKSIEIYNGTYTSFNFFNYLVSNPNIKNNYAKGVKIYNFNHIHYGNFENNKLCKGTFMDLNSQYICSGNIDNYYHKMDEYSTIIYLNNSIRFGKYISDSLYCGIHTNIKQNIIEYGKWYKNIFSGGLTLSINDEESARNTDKDFEIVVDKKVCKRCTLYNNIKIKKSIYRIHDIFYGEETITDEITTFIGKIIYDNYTFYGNYTYKSTDTLFDGTKIKTSDSTDIYCGTITNDFFTDGFKYNLNTIYCGLWTSNKLTEGTIIKYSELNYPILLYGTLNNNELIEGVEINSKTLTVSYGEWKNSKLIKGVKISYSSFTFTEFIDSTTDSPTDSTTYSPITLDEITINASLNYDKKEDYNNKYLKYKKKYLNLANKINKVNIK